MKKEYEYNFNPESMLKGRMAESLVEEMLRKSGYSVYRFGYEAILQNLSQIRKAFDRDTDAGGRIRAIPDFIVLDKKGAPVFVEVKFRWNGKLHKKDFESLERIKEFWNAKMVFVNCSEKPFFRVVNPPYVKDGELIEKPLQEDNHWKISEDLYEEFEALVDKYLTPTLITNSESKTIKQKNKQ